MDAVESSVAEDDDDVAGFRQRLELLNNVVGCWLIKSRLSGRRNICHDAFRIEPLALGNLLDARDARKEDAVGLSERPRQLMLENSAAGGV